MTIYADDDDDDDGRFILLFPLLRCRLFLYQTRSAFGNEQIDDASQKRCHYLMMNSTPKSEDRCC